MSTFFDGGEYSTWRKNRFNAIIEHYGVDFFKGKTMLEVGAAEGDFGAMFADIGCKVTSYEGREENFQNLLLKHPNQNGKKVNLEVETITEKFDIILHVGLLYHLFNFENNLKNCMEQCEHLILETEVVDSARSGYWTEYEPIDNQGSNIMFERVTRPSCSYLESFITKNGFDFNFPQNPTSINTSPWTYDWKRNSINSNTIGLRQMWFCKKKP
jgi:hypothetical protein